MESQKRLAGSHNVAISLGRFARKSEQKSFRCLALREAVTALVGPFSDKEKIFSAVRETSWQLGLCDGMLDGAK